MINDTPKRADIGVLLKRLVRMLADLQSAEESTRKARQATRAAVGIEIRAERERVGMSLRAMSAKVGCSAPFLSDMELGRRGQSIEWVTKILNAAKHHNNKLTDEVSGKGTNV